MGSRLGYKTRVRTSWCSADLVVKHCSRPECWTHGSTGWEELLAADMSAGILEAWIPDKKRQRLFSRHAFGLHLINLSINYLVPKAKLMRTLGI